MSAGLQLLVALLHGHQLSFMILNRQCDMLLFGNSVSVLELSVQYAWSTRMFNSALRFRHYFFTTPRYVLSAGRNAFVHRRTRRSCLALTNQNVLSENRIVREIPASYTPARSYLHVARNGRPE